MAWGVPPVPAHHTLCVYDEGVCDGTWCWADAEADAEADVCEYEDCGDEAIGERDRNGMQACSVHFSGEAR